MTSTLPGELKKPKEPIDCLKCGKEFMSWDKKLNRVCPSCTGLNRGVGANTGHYESQIGRRSRKY